MIKPEFVTFTGADDTTDIGEMVALAADYPVEFGLLFSPKQQGNGRYPSLDFIQRVCATPDLILAAHICGGYARELVAEGRSAVDVHLGPRFTRAQINTSDPNVSSEAISHWAFKRDLEAILQCRGPFPPDRHVYWLYDKSGGTGLTPDSWPGQSGGFVGYAGGLNPDNVMDALVQMKAHNYWIDMESGVRDEQDRFSIAKCRAVCEAVYGR